MTLSLCLCFSIDFNIDAPPSFKPAKKYSDISGLPVSIFFFHSKLASHPPQ